MIVQLKVLNLRKKTES
jgi:hypothetical protein